MSDHVQLEEILIGSIAGMLDGLGHVAVGASSPVPGAAALLTRARSNGATRVSVLGSENHNFFTDGAKELFDCAGQGRIDAFFLGGAQIDGKANINLVSIGDPDRPKARFPVSFGSAYMYYVVPRVILFRLEHTPRTLVDAVEPFIDAIGDFLFPIAEDGLPARREVNLAVAHVPVPDTIICACNRKRVALLALAQRVLGTAALDRVADSATEQLAVHFALDQVILSTLAECFGA